MSAFNFSDLAKNLLLKQKENWEQCNNGYDSLNSVQDKIFSFDSFTIKVQFNPGRIVSTAAKVDTKSISERRCFLCRENLPQQQNSIEYIDNFLILCNPFPIFPEHFTLPSIEHTQQNIKNSFSVFLDFTKDLSKYYSVFYNGPKCGASAPDHLHFQAGSKYFMTIEKEFESVKAAHGKKIFEASDVEVNSIDDGLRKFISIEGTSRKTLENVFEKFFNCYSIFNYSEPEPMLNIIGFYENETWRIIIFLRAKHRPSHFFAEGDKQIILSPASVDVGGVCITPLEKDFEKITQDHLREIFWKIFLTKEESNLFAKKLVSALQS